MKLKTALLPLALATAPLATLLGGCADDGYGRGGLYWSSYPYSGWYDDYYGPIFDGYWGTDNFFYFRQRDRDRVYRRDRQQHFRRGEAPPGDRFRRFEGSSQQPPRVTRMPNYPKGGDRHGPPGRRP